MSMFSKIIGQVQGYAKQNPDKVSGVTDKVARFADQRSKGKYRSQIDSARRKVDGVTGGGRRQPRRDNIQDPDRNDSGDTREDPRNS